jgi:hypothetical protein
MTALIASTDLGPGFLLLDVRLRPDAEATYLEAHLEGSLASLTARFGIDATRSGRWISWGVLVASFLSAAAFCAALVLFLHRIWGVLPPTAHSLILLVIPLLVLAAAEFNFRRQGRLYYTALLALAAGVGFVMESNALGSIFNLVPSAHALLAWGSFGILLAHAYGLRLLLGAGLLLLCAYSASLFAIVEGAFWANFVERPETLIPAAVVVYGLPSLVYRRDRNDFRFVYRTCGAAWMLFAILVLSIAGNTSYLDFPTRTIETLYQVAGLVLSGGVVFHGIRLGRIGMVNLGALSFVVFLYVKLYAWWWAWMPKYLFFLLIGLTAVLLLYLFGRLRAGVSRRAPE